MVGWVNYEWIISCFPSCCSIYLVYIMLGHFLYQVKGLSGLLKTNLEKGISCDDTDLSKRRNSFGSNTYPLKKGRSFLVLFDITFLFFLSIAIFCKVYTASCYSFLCLLLQNFLWEAWQDLTLIILIVAAVASLALGIKTEVF